MSGTFPAQAAEFAATGGRVRVSEPAPGVFLSEIDGRATTGVVGVMIRVAEEMLAERRAHLDEPKLSPATGYLSVYRRAVQPMSTGAVLIETKERRRRG